MNGLTQKADINNSLCGSSDLPCADFTRVFILLCVSYDKAACDVCPSLSQNSDVEWKRSYLSYAYFLWQIGVRPTDYSNSQRVQVGYEIIAFCLAQLSPLIAETVRERLIMDH